MPLETLSIKDMFLNADPIVQGVMVLLFLASLLCWIIIIEKIILLHGSRREIRFFLKKAMSWENIADIENFPALTKSILKTGVAESDDHTGGESRADFRERVERAMKSTLSQQFDRIRDRTVVLATVGSISPFIGLFGTVWGIMHSFMGISASGEVSLAVVAPGIAEALFATAMGLAAAIPAVLAYNYILGALRKIQKDALFAVSIIGNHLARNHFRQLDKETGHG